MKMDTQDLTLQYDNKYLVRENDSNKLLEKYINRVAYNNDSYQHYHLLNLLVTLT